MGIYRIPIVKDATISTYSSIPALRKFGNTGASQINDVWGWYNQDDGNKYLARILAQANLTALQNAILNGDVPNMQTDSTVSCNLNFFHIQTEQPQAYDFTLNVFPITTPWAEGKGTRIDSFTTTGYASWVSASPTASWSAAGGDYDGMSPASAVQYFETGAENLSVNIRTLLNNWLSGASSNNGVIIKMDNNAETLTASTSSTNLQYYRKSFHGRWTNFTNFGPRIDILWNDQIADQRKMVTYGQSVKLYFYNLINGQYADIDNSTSYFPGTVTVYGLTANGTSAVNINSLTASRVKKGVYSVSFTIPVTAGSYTAFTDVWTVTSSASAITPLVTQSFYPVSTVQAQQTVDWYQTAIKIMGWRGHGDNEAFFPKGTKKTFRLFVSQNTGKIEPVLVQSEKNSISSIASSAVSSLIITDGYWRVITDALEVVDLDWQPLSYDSFSNFFMLDTDQFYRYVVFRIQFKLNFNGQTIIKDETSSKFEIL